MKDLLPIVTELNDAWNEAFNSGDIDKLTSMYAENATLSPGNGEVLSSHKEIAALFNSFIEAGVNQHTLEVLEVDGNDTNLFQVARWRAKGAESNGETPKFGGITMSVLEKDASGQWKTRAHVWNAAQ